MNDVPTLTFKEAVQNARKAHSEGRLGAQRRRPTCRYSYGDGAVCALGASFVPEDESLNTSPIETVVARGALKVPDDELPAMAALQSTHDCWALGSHIHEATSVNLLWEAPEWVQAWVHDNLVGKACDEATFLDFLTTAERQLGLVGEA